MLSTWEIVGTLGIWCIEASYAPQILRLWRRKEADDISLLFPGLNVLGRVLALIYSIHMGSSVFIFGFMLGIFMRSALLSQVIYYRWLRPGGLLHRAGRGLAASAGVVEEVGGQGTAAGGGGDVS